MSTGPFDIGDRVRLVANFTDLDGAATDPTSVTLHVKDPSGNVTTVSASSTGTTGEYAGTVDVDEAGVWFYRFAGTGAVVAAEEASFLVNTRNVPAPS